MKNIYTDKVVLSNADIACALMDRLNDEGIEHKITLENRKYAFAIVIPRIKYATIERVYEEVLR